MKRITIATMHTCDGYYDDSRTRLIEMIVDGLAGYGLHCVQFWRDVDLYGLPEAVTLLKRNLPKVTDWTELDAAANEMVNCVAKMRVECADAERRIKRVEANSRFLDGLL